LRPRDGFLKNLSEQMLRSPRRPMPVGTRVALTGVTFEITAALPDGRPAEARARFDVPLEDPSLYWAAWRDQGYAPFTPPPVGARVQFPPVDFFKVVFPKPER
jgi:hypothetical protein